MGHYTMLYEYGKRTRDFFEVFLLCFFFLSLASYIFEAFLIKQLFHSPLLDMRVANSELCASLAIYHIQRALVE